MTLSVADELDGASKSASHSLGAVLPGSLVPFPVENPVPPDCWVPPVPETVVPSDVFDPPLLPPGSGPPEPTTLPEHAAVRTEVRPTTRGRKARIARGLSHAAPLRQEGTNEFMRARGSNPRARRQVCVTPLRGATPRASLALRAPAGLLLYVLTICACNGKETPTPATIVKTAKIG